MTLIEKLQADRIQYKLSALSWVSLIFAAVFTYLDASKSSVAILTLAAIILYVGANVIAALKAGEADK